jgi:hypothetical protein
MQPGRDANNERVSGKEDVGILHSVSVFAVLVGKQPVVSLVDPAGGRSEAAGKFNGLLPDDMAAIAAEIQRLVEVARPGPELRGIRRLQTLATRTDVN